MFLWSNKENYPCYPFLSGPLLKELTPVLKGGINENGRVTSLKRGPIYLHAQYSNIINENSVMKNT